MALGRSKNRRGDPPTDAPSPPQAPANQPAGMVRLFERGIELQAQTKKQLEAGLASGLEFYRNYNETRLQLAYDAFDPDMRKALFEIIFLLHVNTPQLSDIKYTATRKDNSKGIPKFVEVSAKANLYLEGAPAGVRGIDSLSPILQKPFRDFIRSEFGMEVPPGSRAGPCPVVCLQSIGSIGTIGHKSTASDLDLQVVYEPFPLRLELSEWNDDKLRDALHAEQNWWVERLAAKQKMPAGAAKNPVMRQKLSAAAARKLDEAYPTLYKILSGKDDGTAAKSISGSEGRNKLINETMALIRRNQKVSEYREVAKQEELLRKRVETIQNYITDKYPTAEIYMFLCSLDRYRAGRYTSSLKFKESSGSAYELILNYETLMPGIHFSPTIPSHFIFPEFVNNNTQLYQRLHDYIDFAAIDVYSNIAPMLVDLGATPQLKTSYVAEHWGAAYWEAFKASSGNLPKATLNLLRYEMMLHPHLLKTNVQTIKDPEFLGRLITSKSESSEQVGEKEKPLPPWALIDMERFFPLLLQDPWWLRYKALKAGFAEEGGVPDISPEERVRVSRILDLAFALHLRISDVFTKPGVKRDFDTHREQVLVQLLDMSFPTGSDRRKLLEHIVAGEVSAVNHFENELRELFGNSLKRIQGYISAAKLDDLHKHNDEVKLWRHYYEENFNAKPNMITRSILHHLKFPRGRVQIGYEKGKGWFFKSLQRQSNVGKRFDRYGMLDHLPDEITLVDGKGFLHGLSSCIINGYYGVIDKGSLKERRTAMEFDAKHLDTGNNLDNDRAFVRPDNVERIVDHILNFFPYEYHPYTDFLTEDRVVRKIFLFLNLWKFGQLSILYRDNLNTWFCDEFDHPELAEQVDTLQKSPEAMLGAPALHESLDLFLLNKRLYFDQVEIKTWVNPHSVETGRSGVLAEETLAEAFTEAIQTFQRNADAGPRFT